MRPGHPIRPAAMLCAATTLIGLAWILVMPPFEGFDETAHYSSIREVADMRSVPAYGTSRMSTVVEHYGANAPLPYMQHHGIVHAAGISYRDFMQDAPARERYLAAFRTAPDAHRRHSPGASLNWQAQHPPLYYALLAPLMRVTDGLSLVSQIMVLRCASWLLAVAGLAVGVIGTARDLGRAAGPDIAPNGMGESRRLVHVACLAFPFMVPMFFPEFARLGNDSLCLLMFGASWGLLLSLLTADCGHRARLMRRALALGICLGCGLLTKAFFIPISVGMLGCLGWSAWRSPRGRMRQQAAMATSLVAATALLIGGWWYAIALLKHGELTGANDFIALEGSDGLVRGLAQHFAWRDLARGVLAIGVTAYFAGTWTLARLPELLYAPGPLALAVLCVMAARRARTMHVHTATVAMAWILVPVLAGLCYHLLVRIAGGMQGHGTPGWYLNILAPACAVPLAAGAVAMLLEGRGARLVAHAMWAWMLAFTVASYWLHAALYAGIALKDMTTRELACPDGWSSLASAGLIHERLAVIGWPSAGFACLVAGVALAGLGWLTLARDARRWIFR